MMSTMVQPLAAPPMTAPAPAQPGMMPMPMMQPGMMGAPMMGGMPPT